MKFLTVRKTANELSLPENMLRTMIKKGECPGFYNGNRFMVNVEMLQDNLRERSFDSVAKSNWYKPLEN